MEDQNKKYEHAAREVNALERIPPDEFNAYRRGCYACFCGPFANQSCGYPPRTIRAIVAFIFAFAVLGTTCFTIIYFAISGNPEASIGLVGALIGELGVITTAYFSAKNNNEPPDTKIVRNA